MARRFWATGHPITHATVQVGPTDPDGCKEAHW
jgi:hypothetical protein